MSSVHSRTPILMPATSWTTKPPAPASNRFPLPDASDGSEVNHPANIAVTYEALAELRHLPLDVLAEQVARNFHQLFG